MISQYDIIVIKVVKLAQDQIKTNVYLVMMVILLRLVYAIVAILTAKIVLVNQILVIHVLPLNMLIIKINVQIVTQIVTLVVNKILVKYI